MSRPTKEQYEIAVNGVRVIKNLISEHKRDIDQHLDYIIDIKNSINELEEALARNEELVMRYELYKEMVGEN